LLPWMLGCVGVTDTEAALPPVRSHSVKAHRV
jgi:hypothetical protein